MPKFQPKKPNYSYSPYTIPSRLFKGLLILANTSREPEYRRAFRTLDSEHSKSRNALLTTLKYLEKSDKVDVEIAYTWPKLSSLVSRFANNTRDLESFASDLRKHDYAQLLALTEPSIKENNDLVANSPLLQKLYFRLTRKPEEIRKLDLEMIATLPMAILAKHIEHLSHLPTILNRPRTRNNYLRSHAQEISKARKELVIITQDLYALSILIPTQNQAMLAGISSSISKIHRIINHKALTGENCKASDQNNSPITESPTRERKNILRSISVPV